MTHLKFIGASSWFCVFCFSFIAAVTTAAKITSLQVALCTEPEIIFHVFFFLWRCGPTRAMTSSYTRFLDHTQRRTTVGRTPLDEWSARRRDLYLTAHNIHNRRKSMPPVGFESTISASEGPQTYALDRAATGTGNYISCSSLNVSHRSVTEILYFSHMCISHYIPVSPSCVMNFFFFS